MTRVGGGFRMTAGGGLDGEMRTNGISACGGGLRMTPVPDWGRSLPWLWAGTTWRVDGFVAGEWPGNGDEAVAAVIERGIEGRPLSQEREADSGIVATEREVGAGARANDGAEVGGGVTQREIAAVTEALRKAGWATVVRSRQVHGARCRIHRADGLVGQNRNKRLPTGECMADDGDGHATRDPGVLLAVTLADCVPVFVADPVNCAVGIFHAGWRGTAAGVVENGLRAMRGAFGSEAAELRLHLGPAICGRCYEVGPEVFAALGEIPPPRPHHLDLRRVIRRRVLATGVPPGHLTTSAECTLCGDGRYYSYRGGDGGRHLGLIGIVAER